MSLFIRFASLQGNIFSIKAQCLLTYILHIIKMIFSSDSVLYTHLTFSNDISTFCNIILSALGMRCDKLNISII